jgi:hypothetical protein
MRTRIDSFFPPTEVACFNYLISDFIYVLVRFYERFYSVLLRFSTSLLGEYIRSTDFNFTYGSNSIIIAFLLYIQ